VDGEIIVPDVDFETGAGAIRSYEPTPDAVFMIFDLPIIPEPFRLRYAYYMSLCHAHRDFPYEPVFHETIFNFSQLQDRFERVIERGLEGLVFKDPESFYSAGYTSLWLKMKRSDTIDLLVVDMYAGKGKYTGMLGGVICQIGPRTVRVGGGFTDEDRKYYWNFPSRIIGKIIEVSFQEKTNKGSLCHPNFEYLRYDKEA